MPKNVYIVFDCSGSMSEHGKPAIIRNANRVLRRWTSKEKYKNTQFSYYHWSIDVILWEKGKITIQENASEEKLMDFIQHCPSDSGIILLSDGCFSPDRIREVLHETGVTLFPVAIGSDADWRVLEKVSSVKSVYKVSSIIGVLDRICFTSDQGG